MDKLKFKVLRTLTHLARKLPDWCVGRFNTVQYLWNKEWML